MVADAAQVDSAFLFAIVQSDRFVEAASISYGTHMPRTDWDIMQNFEICLPPPLHEQRAIVTALSDVDGLIGALDALIEKKRAIKQAAMQQLLTGKKRLPGFAGEWETKQLGDHATLIRNGTTYVASLRDGVPITRIETISSGFVDFSKVGYAKYSKVVESYKLQPGDILYSHINSIDHIGKVALVSDVQELYHGMNLLMIRSGNNTNSKWLFYVLNSDFSRNWARSIAKQAVSQASINTKEIKNFFHSNPSSSRANRYRRRPLRHGRRDRRPRTPPGEGKADQAGHDAAAPHRAHPIAISRRGEHTMSAERCPPADLGITHQDFADCGWKEVLAQTERDGYWSMWQAFHAAAQRATADGQQSDAKVLWLLGDACSMMLSPKSINEPFKPATVMREGRSAIPPEDLLDSDITFLSEIVDSIDDPWLKARLADLVWIRKRPRDVRYALVAIDSYRSIPLDTETWVSDGRECWERAIGLAHMLKAGGSKDRLREMENAVIRAFETATCRDGFLALWLADLLFDNGLGRDKQSIIAQKLESLAREFDDEGDFRRAREFFKASAKWFKAAGDTPPKSIEMTVAVAESFVKEAEARIAAEKPSHMAAASFYEDAIQTYRTIPRSERPAHRVDERLKELQLRLNESGKMALDEMRVISIPGIDLSQCIEDARNSVHGKSTIEALERSPI